MLNCEVYCILKHNLFYKSALLLAGESQLTIMISIITRNGERLLERDGSLEGHTALSVLNTKYNLSRVNKMP